MIFGHGLQRFYGLATQPPKIGRSNGNLRATDAIEQSIKSRRGKTFEGETSSILNPLRLYNVITLFKQIDHLQNKINRVLSIGIQRNDKVTARGIESSGQRGLVTKVAGKLQNDEA